MAELWLISLTAGCWEEIKYEPTPPSVRSETASSDVLPINTAEIATIPPAAPPAITTASEPLSPPTSELEPQSSPVTSSPDGGPIAETSTSPVDESNVEPPGLFGDPAPVVPAVPEGSAGIPAAAEAVAATPAERLLVWQAASQWSLAAAMRAKSLPAQRYEPIEAEAAAAAAKLSLELPAIPAPAAGESPEAPIIAALSGELAARLVAAATERYGPAAGALAALAIRSNLLLLTYSPRRLDLTAEAEQFTAAAEESALPRDAWQPLALLLDSGGEYLAVRTAVFELHRRTDSALVAAAAAK